MSEGSKKYLAYGLALGGWLLALFIAGPANINVDTEALKNFIGEAASNEITQAGFFFTLAAWLHSGRVKKEIKLNFVSLTEAINNVAESLRADLESHSLKIEKHAGALDNLSTRVQTVENNLKLTGSI